MGIRLVSRHFASYTMILLFPRLNVVMLETMDDGRYVLGIGARTVKGLWLLVLLDNDYYSGFLLGCSPASLYLVGISGTSVDWLQEGKKVLFMHEDRDTMRLHHSTY